MPQFCILFYANYPGDPKGGRHGPMPPSKYALDEVPICDHAACAERLVSLKAVNQPANSGGYNS